MQGLPALKTYFRKRQGWSHLFAQKPPWLIRV